MNHGTLYAGPPPQAKAYFKSRGWEIVAEYMSSPAYPQPEFQRMIDSATTKPPAFDVILVHCSSRFFRNQFQLEFYVRRLAKAGVRGATIRSPHFRAFGDRALAGCAR